MQQTAYSTAHASRPTAAPWPPGSPDVRARPGAGAAGRRARNALAAVVLVVAGVNLGAVVAVGAARFSADVAAPGGLATWGGRMTGLLAEVLVLGLVLLAARVPWLERAFGQDRLLRWHRWVAPTALVMLVAHPLLLALGSAPSALSWWPSLLSLGSTTLDAVVGTGLFLLASATSVRAVRRRMPYEGWHLLHLTTYAAVVLAFWHQLTVGSVVLDSALLRAWWLAQLVVVLAAALVFRVVLPVWRSHRHQLRVAGVTRHGGEVVSVTVTGQDLSELSARGGQFFVWRFLDAAHWWRAHPFSLSATGPHAMRLTAREVGDGTRALGGLRPGTRVLVEGPYGVLTAAARTRDRVLLIGAGLGIAPLRSLLADLPPHVDAVVVQRASTADDAVLHDELQRLAADRPLTTVHLVAGRRGHPGDRRRPLGPGHLRWLVPDVAERDVYLCAPPTLTRSLQDSLTALGVPAECIHYESFEL